MNGTLARRIPLWKRMLVSVARSIEAYRIHLQLKRSTAWN